MASQRPDHNIDPTSDRSGEPVPEVSTPSPERRDLTTGEAPARMAPRTAVEPLTPEQLAAMTPEQKDDWWFKNVYQGDRMPQLTLRAVLMGGVLGMLMSVSNLYTTLAIGWGFGVAITACVMSFVIWNGIRAVTGNSVTRMSILENNCMQSTAAAAGSSTGATIGVMFGAMLLYAKVPEGKTAADVATWDVNSWWQVGAFTLASAALGTFLAVPMKRQMINHEQLRFPSGVAAAETLQSLYSDSVEALHKAYVLLLGLVAGLILGVLNTGEGTLKALDRFFEKVHIRLPEAYPFPGTAWLQQNLWAGKPAGGFSIEPSLLLVAAGVITRMRVSLSMFLGSALLYFVVGPALVRRDQLASLDPSRPANGWSQAGGAWSFTPAAVAKDAVLNIELPGGGALALTRWALWGGTAVMVCASMTALAFQWRTIGRVFSGLLGEKKVRSDALDAIEVPNSWMVVGLIPITIVMVVIQVVAFDIHWWAGLIAVGMSFVLSMVACRSTGETDTNPIGAMGKVMQLTFAVLQRGMVVPNLAAAGVAANSASASADLLTDLKSGYLLGANPRKQFIAQFIGIFFGTLAIVPAWFLMIPNKAALEKYALPATQQWAAVARVLTEGLHKLPDSAKMAMVIGALVGISIPLIERVVPRKARGYLPSTMGLGLSWVIPFGNALGFFLGAVIVWLWELLHRRSSDKYSVAVASGLIAGESLMKAIIAMAATAVGLLAK